MRIGVLSDSHGCAEAIKQAVSLAGEIDLWLHAGDLSQDTVYIKHDKIVAVAGNCDGFVVRKVDEFIEVEGLRIWLTHGHRYKAKINTNELLWWAKKYEANIVVYGHTHRPNMEYRDDILLMNPGSIGFPPRGLKPTFGILEIKAGKILKPNIITLA